MKKIHLILSVLGLLVVSCSTTSLFPAATSTTFVPPAAPTEMLSAPTPLPTETLSATSTSMPSVTPAQPTPTFTSTPTFASTGTALTGTMVPLTTTAQLTATSTIQIPPTPQGPVFVSVTTSGNQMIWGDTCDANAITFTVQVTGAYNVTSVLLFTRLQGQNGNVTTTWNKAVSMHSAGMGTFTYDVSAEALKYYQQFNTAWVQYQFVATNIQGQQVGPDLDLREQSYAYALSIDFIYGATGRLLY